MNKILTIKKEGIIAKKFRSQRAITEMWLTHRHTNFIHTRMGGEKGKNKISFL